jgi:hypothetical protein
MWSVSEETKTDKRHVYADDNGDQLDKSLRMWSHMLALDNETSRRVLHAATKLLKILVS